MQVLGFALLSACQQYSQVADQTPAPDPVEKETPAYTNTANTLFAKIALQEGEQAKDQAAILAMQGEYKVGFDFEETVILKEDYERSPGKKSGAFETVVVVEATPNKVVLQHLLQVGGGAVVKHWRQDWFYEADSRFEFVEDQTWELREIPEDKREGQWTQCVYEVSDAPRYCGTGKWNHKYGVSTWTSDRSWRPLPRREYTKRSDYNALNVENRHTVTPLGWTHEQDNTKVIREGKKTQATLVREFGFNNYRRIDGFDFSPAYAYWEKTADYWSKVRSTWAGRFTKNKQVKLNTEVDGMPIIEATFSHAESIQSGSAAPDQSDIDEVFKQWVSLNLN